MAAMCVYSRVFVLCVHVYMFYLCKKRYLEMYYCWKVNLKVCLRPYRATATLVVV